MQNIHALLPRMRLDSALDAPRGAAAPVAQAQVPPPVVRGKVTLRALLGEDQGISITIPRTTGLAALPGC